MTGDEIYNEVVRGGSNQREPPNPPLRSLPILVATLMLLGYTLVNPT